SPGLPASPLAPSAPGAPAAPGAPGAPCGPGTATTDGGDAAGVLTTVAGGVTTVAGRSQAMSAVVARRDASSNDLFIHVLQSIRRKIEGHDDPAIVTVDDWIAHVRAATHTRCTQASASPHGDADCVDH